MSARLERPRGNDRRGVLAASALVLSALLLTACYASDAAAPRGSALDPSAAAAPEREAVDVLRDDFDPFSAYPELAPGEGGHQHHHGMQMNSAPPVDAGPEHQHGQGVNAAPPAASEGAR